MSYFIKNIFSQSIYGIDSLLSDNEIKDLIQECKDIKQNIETGGDNWKCDTYNTLGTYDLRKNIKFKKLIDLVTLNVNSFAKQLKSNHTYSCGSCWFNIYKKGDYQEYHYHSDAFFSAIFVLKTPDPPPKVIFENPVLDMYPLRNVEYNDLNAGVYNIGMRENTLIIFRSYLKHMVEKLKQDNERISIALNF